MRKDWLVATTILFPIAAFGQTPQSGSATLPTTPTQAQVCASLPAVPTLLPCGMFHTDGSQTVDQTNRPVRLTCTAWWGDVPNIDRQMLTLVVAGFNCLRVSYYNASIDSDLGMIDTAVAAAAKVGIRVIVNNHANEGKGACGAQQANGLWFDQGPGTNGTDGCGTSGTVTADRWVSDWVKVAKHYAGNQTVIGYDLWNEPFSCNWGGGGPNDIRAAYTRAGNAIQAVDSGPLIIAEGCIVWQPIYQEDSRGEKANPLTLTVPNKVVMSAHLYPKSIGGQPDDNGPAYIASMNAAFGFLITENIAPVWIGEMGASMNSPADQAWANTVVSYLNGEAPGGLVVPAGGFGPGTDWWMWSCLPNVQPDSPNGPNGALKEDKTTVRPEQAAVFSQFDQTQIGAPIAGTTADAFNAQMAILSAQAFPNQTVPADTAQTDPSAPSQTPGTTKTAPPTSAPFGAVTGEIVPGGVLTDPAGNTWDISKSGSVQKNGQWTPGGGGTAALTAQNGTVYGQDSSGKGWFALSKDGTYWTPAQAPTQTTVTTSQAMMPTVSITGGN